MGFGTQSRTFEQEYDQRIKLHSQGMEEPNVTRNDSQDIDTRQSPPRRSQEDYSAVEENNKTYESPHETDQPENTSSSSYSPEKSASSRPSESSQHNPAQEPSLHRINRTSDFLRHPALSRTPPRPRINEEEIELEDVDLTDQVQRHDYSNSRTPEFTPPQNSSQVRREASSYRLFPDPNQLGNSNRISSGPQTYISSAVPNPQLRNPQTPDLGFWRRFCGIMRARYWWAFYFLLVVGIAGLVAVWVEYKAVRL